MIFRFDSWLLSKTQAVSDWVMDHFHVTNYRIGTVVYIFFFAAIYLIPLTDYEVWKQPPLEVASSLFLNVFLIGLFVYGWAIIPLYKTITDKEERFHNGDMVKNELEIKRFGYRILTYLVVIVTVVGVLMKTTVTVTDYIQVAFIPLIVVAEYFLAVTPRPPKKRTFTQLAHIRT